jgi:succinate dehydrogenase/fumarate reductase flavoprotein subunit
MATWHDYLKQEGTAPKWPYPIRYDQEQEIEADVLIVGGGIAGCWAAISAARSGAKVVLMEKGDTVRSGAGGPGCDHWCDAPANPHSKVDPDEWAKRFLAQPYANGIGRQIQCREDWDALQEMEQMGGKIRDTSDEYLGAEGRYDDKIMFSPRYSPNHTTEVVIRVWGTTFKPALKRECKRLGVKIFDRVMVTNLLTEGGVQGGKVVGATGVNNRTGEFLVVKSKATILSTAGNYSLFMLNTELSGYTTFRSRAMTGDGFAMAWRAGAELALMERSSMLGLGTGYKHTWYSGASDASYENIQQVDANGKKLPWPLQGWPDGGAMGPSPTDREAIRKGLQTGEYALPFYGDFPGMPEVERRVTWNLMLGEESTTKIIIDTYNKAGFDPAKHQLQNYSFIEGTSPAQWRNANAAGPMVDWDLKSSLDGLYIAGEQMFSHGDHSYAAATGRYAGRKAAAYASQIGTPTISKDQVALEKVRIYAPIKRAAGLEWKELQAGIARVMQYFCSEYKDEHLLTLGMEGLKQIEEEYVPKLYALDPHKLMRSLEDLNLLAHGQVMINASLARKASSQPLGFFRIDYPKVDPPEWNKFITVRMENNKVKTKDYPMHYFGNQKENYEARNKDYKGVYSGKRR